MDRFHKIIRISGIQDLTARKPTAPRHKNAIAQVSQVFSGMGVGGNDELDTALPRRPNPTRLQVEPDRKSTRLNSSHLGISYAVFCLKKKTQSFNARR